MKNITSLGSCVSRDVFNLVQDRYKVLLNIQRNPIKTMFGEPLKLDGYAYNRAGEGGWISRMIKYNCEKLIPAVLSENPTDYIIIDLVAERTPVGMYEYQSKHYLLPLFPVFLKLAENVPELKHIKKIMVSEISEEELDDCIGKFVQMLLQIYKQQQIVIHRFLPVKQYVDENMKLCDFTNPWYDAENLHMNTMYDKLEKLLPEAHVIKMPDCVFGDKFNRWGARFTHLYETYYKYVLDCMDIICGFSMQYTLEQRYQVECRRNKFIYNNLRNIDLIKNLTF